MIRKIAIRSAAIVCLVTLALGLLGGADPLSAAVRSGMAFVTFAVLGWTASHLWAPSIAGEEANRSEQDNDAAETDGELNAATRLRRTG